LTFLPHLSLLVFLYYLFTVRSYLTHPHHFPLIPARAHPPHASNVTRPMRSCPRLRSCLFHLSFILYFSASRSSLVLLYQMCSTKVSTYMYLDLSLVPRMSTVLFPFRPCVGTVQVLGRLLPPLHSRLAHCFCPLVPLSVKMRRDPLDSRAVNLELALCILVSMRHQHGKTIEMARYTVHEADQVI
jgi:hypothetical protein